jgi:hypothetical protein
MSAIEDNEYKPDFEILDRYLKFSSELLRISLLAIGGFGTIVLVKLKGEESAGSLTNLTFLFLSICFFALCAGSALFHRFYASDSMSWHVAYLRAKHADNFAQAEKEKAGRNKMLRRSSFALILAEILFGISVALFAVGIYQVIFK